MFTISTLHFLPNPLRIGLSSGKDPEIKSISPKFNTYENFVYGISIDYPISWQKIEFGGNSLLATFVSNSTNESGLLENVDLQVIDLPYHNKTTLKDIVTEEISSYKSEVPGFHLLSTGFNATYSGIPTYKLEYLHTNGRLQISTMEILTIKGNEGYKIIFSADAPEYRGLLSIVTRMVDSFNFSYPKQQLNVGHA